MEKLLSQSIFLPFCSKSRQPPQKQISYETRAETKDRNFRANAEELG